MTQAIKRIHYRASQFFASLTAQVSDDDWRLIRDTFAQNEKALALFERMSKADQRHALAILKNLHQHGHSEAALLQAALLHDVGKSLGQPLIYRVVIVLLRLGWPTLLKRLGQGEMSCAAWRKPFVVNLQHPQIGANWANDAGCDPLVATLIRTHQEPPSCQPKTAVETLHLALYRADNAN